mmetsp:Transcript_39951/g.85216  ORF Transcript_39951/g.85216 Transcript_39951/m.85216 type:complete len:245 (-) Transcript_39951:816-1550(-)
MHFEEIGDALPNGDQHPWVADEDFWVAHVEDYGADNEDTAGEVEDEVVHCGGHVRFRKDSEVRHVRLVCLCRRGAGDVGDVGKVRGLGRHTAVGDLVLVADFSLGEVDVWNRRGDQGLVDLPGGGVIEDDRGVIGDVGDVVRPELLEIVDRPRLVEFMGSYAFKFRDVADHLALDVSAATHEAMLQARHAHPGKLQCFCRLHRLVDEVGCIGVDNGLCVHGQAMQETQFVPAEALVLFLGCGDV